MNDLGLYVHIPFCKSKCHYCDFCSFSHAEDEMEAYCDALVKEIEEAARIYGNRPVSTVYFGGGTPTTLPLPLISTLANAIFHHFSIASDAEITTECNPGTVDLGYLSSLRALGFNRISMGAQSMNDRELKLLGRIHTAADTVETFANARRAGFENISLDLMLGIPEQTPKSLEGSLAKLVSLAPEHISAYGLKIEEGTPFFAQKETLPLPDEDTERALYMNTVSFLAEHGYARYEISNFARSGYESRHNLRYWKRQDYLGIGLAAHSCIGDHRFWNTTSLPDYLAGKAKEGNETISPNDVLCETIMLAMRLDKGLNIRALRERFGEAADPYIEGLLRFLKTGLVRREGDRVAFTNDGTYVSNAILADVLDFEENNTP